MVSNTFTRAVSFARPLKCNSKNFVVCLSYWRLRWQDPSHLFTAQWADLPFETMCQMASDWGFDGLEIACWGDHFEVDKAMEDDSYVQGRWDILNKYNLQMFRNWHPPGRPMCMAIIRSTSATRAFFHPVSGAMEILKAFANVVRKKLRIRRAPPPNWVLAWLPDLPAPRSGIRLAGFPPVPPEMIEDGYQDFADRWNPILDVFDEVGVKFASRGSPFRNRL